MSERCTQCGQLLKPQLFKVVAGYYETKDYFVTAESPMAAESVVRKLVKEAIHKDADVVSVESASLLG